MVAAEPDQRNRLVRLRTAVADRFRSAEESVRLRRAQGPGFAISPTVVAEGESRMEEVRATIAEMREVESAQRVLRTATVRAQATTVLITLILICLLAVGIVASAAVWVGRDRGERLKAEQAAASAHALLSDSLANVEAHTLELTLVNETSEMLRLCLTQAEAYHAIQRVMERLCPGASGTLSIISSPRDQVDQTTPLAQVVQAAQATVLNQVAGWGPGESLPERFAPRECCGLRSGRVFERSLAGLQVCEHIGTPAPEGSICVPLTAQGETIGLLNLRRHEPDGQARLAARRLMIVTLAEHFSLAVANLRTQQNLHELSLRDPLTGAYNRRHLSEVFERELSRARRQQQPVGVLMLDVDHFKQFNDTHGHETGDEVLRLVARSILTTIRGEDVLCRYGGEEFALILPGAPIEAVLSRAESIRDNVRQQSAMFHGGRAGQVTLSIGIAMFPTDSMQQAQLLAHADQALYQAKHNGRDRVEQFQSGQRPLNTLVAVA